MINLATLSHEEQKALQRDKVAALWAHTVNTGKTAKGSVLQRIDKIKNESQREDMLVRFNKFLQ